MQANSRRNGERYDQVNRTADSRDRELIDTRKLRAWTYDYDVEAGPELTSWTGPPPRPQLRQPVEGYNHPK